MNSITEKIPVKNFNNFFENDQTSRAFSRLAERKLKKYNYQKYYKYNREELLAISQFPSSKMTKSEFYARLKNPDLDDDIILSFQKKERNDSLNNSDNYRSTSKISNSISGSQTNENVQHKYERIYRFGKYHQDHDSSSQSWRTDRYSPNFRGSKTRDGGNYYLGKRPNSQKYNSRYDHNIGSSSNREHFTEPEPEWFSDGPKSMTDFIDLKGFDDDSNNNNDLQDETNGGSFDESSNSKDVDEKDAFFSDISKDDFSSLLDSSYISLLENNQDFSQFFGNSSRSEKWFKSKSKLASSNNNDEDQSTTTLTSNNSLRDLFQKKNIDISQFKSESSKVQELSDAVNVSELEASLLNNSPSSSNLKNKSTSDDTAIISKLKFLATNSQDDNKLVDAGSTLQTMLQINDSRRTSISSSNINHMHETPHSSSNDSMKKIDNSSVINHNFPFALNSPINQHLRPFLPLPQHHNPFSIPAGDPGVNQVPFNPFYMGGFHQILFNNPALFATHHPVPNLPPNQENPYPNFNLPVPPPTYVIPHDSPNVSSPTSTNFNEYSKQINNSMAHKLLKNSKFTPTSVFRKLKDHDQNKSKSMPPKSIENLSMLNSSISDSLKSDESVKGAEMKDMNSLLKQLTLSPPLNNNSTKLSEVQNSSSKFNLQYSKNVNPNDIFNVFRSTNPISSSGMEFPPLPLQNVLTVEDIEKS